MSRNKTFYNYMNNSTFNIHKKRKFEWGFFFFCTNVFQYGDFIIKTKVLLPQAYVTLADFDYPVKFLWFSCSQRLLALSVPDDGYSRNTCELCLISTFLSLVHQKKRFKLKNDINMWEKETMQYVQSKVGLMFKLSERHRITIT